MQNIEQRIIEKLTNSFQPQELEIINQSNQHSGHAGSPETGESHFHIKILSDKFKGLSKVEAQRQIYSVLSAEMEEGIHALSLNVGSSN